MRVPRVYFALIMTGIFACVHAVFYLLGIRFDTSTVAWFWQYLDTDLLKHHLLQSLFYLHSQPPLFNLFLGCVIKMFSGFYPVALHAAYLVLGLAVYLCLFEVQRMLGIPRWIALPVSTFYIIEPSFVLYEHWFFYTLPMTALLIISVMLFAKYAFTRRTVFIWGFFASLLFISGIRSMFHLVFLVVVAGAAVLLHKKEWRRVVPAALMPIILIGMLYGKNACIFGTFGATSWLGMHIWDIVATHLPEQKKAELAAEGRISGVVMVKTFSPVTKYDPAFLHSRPPPDVPAVTQIFKSNGAPNLNHFAYIRIADCYFKSAVYVIMHYPLAYVKGIMEAWFYYFQPGTELVFLNPNLERISWLNNLFSYQLYRKTSLPDTFPVADKKYFFPVLLLVWPLLFFYGIRVLAVNNNPAVRITIGYICFIMLYVSVLGNCMETWENNRFRFMLGPYFCLFAALFMQRVLVPAAKAFVKKLLPGRFKPAPK